MNDKVTYLVQLSQRERKIAIGASAVEAQVINGRARLIIFAEDVAEPTRQRILRHEPGCPTLVWRRKDDWGAVFDRKEVGVISITDKHFAQGILRHAAEQNK